MYLQFFLFLCEKTFIPEFRHNVCRTTKEDSTFFQTGSRCLLGEPHKFGSAYPTPLRQDELLSWCTYSDSIYLHNNRTRYVIYLAQVVGNVLRYLQCILNPQQSAYLVQYMIEIKKSLKENMCVTFL